MLSNKDNTQLLQKNRFELQKRLEDQRKKQISRFEEEFFIKELLRIIYNRIGLFDRNSSAFGAVFLKQSGLQFEDQLAKDEYNRYLSQITLKYRPHLKIIINRLKFVSVLSNIWPNIELNNKEDIELVLITSIDGRRKQKKKFKLKGSVFTSNNDLEINCQFIHVLTQKSEKVLISLSLTRSQQNFTKVLCNLFQNRISAEDIQTEPLIAMPLTGLQKWYSTDFNNANVTQIRAEVELKLEFIDDPKLISKFRSEKVKSHKNLVSKIYNRWPNDDITSQMKAMIEINRQQSGLTFDENLVLMANVLSEIKELKETNRKYKEFMNLINRAPAPGTDVDFADNSTNNNSNGSGAAVQDKRVFEILKKKLKIRDYF